MLGLKGWEEFGYPHGVGRRGHFRQSTLVGANIKRREQAPRAGGQTPRRGGIQGSEGRKCAGEAARVPGGGKSHAEKEIFRTEGAGWRCCSGTFIWQ